MGLELKYVVTNYDLKNEMVRDCEVWISFCHNRTKIFAEINNLNFVWVVFITFEKFAVLKLLNVTIFNPSEIGGLRLAVALISGEPGVHIFNKNSVLLSNDHFLQTSKVMRSCQIAFDWVSQQVKVIRISSRRSGNSVDMPLTGPTSSIVDPSVVNDSTIIIRTTCTE